MDELTKLGLKHGTDKATGRMYTEKVYYPLMKDLKYEKLNILELGCGDHGSSHKMWRDFFPNAKITLFDPFFFDKTQYPVITPEELRSYNIKVIEGNQLDPNDLELLNPGQEKYDFIIDDASHLNDATQMSLGHLFPFLKSGGHYINRWLDSKDIDQKKKKIYHRVDAHVASSAAFAYENMMIDWPSRYMKTTQKRYLLEHASGFSLPCEAEVLVIYKK